MSWLAMTNLRLVALVGAAALGGAAESQLQVAGPRPVRAGPGSGVQLGAPVQNIDSAEGFSTIQAAIDDPDTLPGHTITVAPGVYPENLWVDTRLILLGAQAGVAAPGRVIGAPDPVLETLISPPSGDALTLVTGSAASIIDGFAFVGGDVGLHATSGPVDQLQLRNNHFQGQATASVRFLVGAGDIGIEANAFLSAPGAPFAVSLGPNDFDGLLFTGNLLRRTGGATGVGLFADGFNNIGPSVARTPLIAQNTVTGHSIGIDLASRSFTGGAIQQNAFSGNGVGLGFGIQNSLISENLFAGNGRALWLSSLGDADPTRGAFGNAVSGNEFLTSLVSAVELDAAQAPGSIRTNIFRANCFEGNTLAVAYAGGEVIDMQENWWGDVSGPTDSTGTNPVGAGLCPPVPLINPGGIGDPLTGENVEYCPWLDTAVCQSLSLLADDCQDDVFPGEPGQQVAFELWMTDLGTLASGFQVFLEFDDAELTYRGDLSTYTLSPFSLHIQDLLGAEVTPGRLRLDGSTALDGSPSQADAQLVTVVFDVALECSSTSLDFDLTQPFPSVVSIAGYGLPTMLANSPEVTLDDTAPVFDVYLDISVASDAGSPGGCGGSIVDYPTPVAVDTCPGPLDIICTPPSGSLLPVGTTTVLCTATDACGNVGNLSFDITVTATNLVDVQIELPGVTGPVSRCVRLVMDDCTTAVSASLSFAAGSPATATATFEVPCGSYMEVFAKDQQHSLWGGAPVLISIDGKRYEALTPLVLAGGDTDDDGDVDINDITWFMGQFGAFAAPGGCPWDGVTRDADFSLNGVVGSEDYVFLTANWLLTSSCGDPALDGGGAGVSRRTTIQSLDATTRHADLDGDGRVDHKDIAIFEQRHGLPHDLSTALRAAQAR